ncbi:MAG: hypothetical protein B6U89_04480 [Desulfurococcales archaeon ex4484_58]|nr:MAG: hypothetical protein B6U89_04480 [Desulfurococcales archaeon ex4484_58]
MYIHELYVKNFRGISEKKLLFHEGINIIRGPSSSGKTSLVDSLLFLQRFSLNPTLTLEYLLNVWFGEAIVYRKAKEFEIMIQTIEGEQRSYFGLRVNISRDKIREFYIVKDTYFIVDGGDLYAQDIRAVKKKPANYSYEETNIWDQIPIRSHKLAFTKLPWKTIAGMISHEASYYGYDVALEKAPYVLSRVLVSKTDLSGEARNLMINRLIDLFKYAFKLHRLFRRSVIIKSIDFKNAVGPTKLRGYVVDPHFSNLPWIIYTLHEKGSIDELFDCLNKIGVNESLSGVSKTVDQRYYLIINSGGREIVREGIPTNFIKLLTICTAACYSKKLIVIDDFDEFLDENLVHALLKTLLTFNKQFILTTRHPYTFKNLDERINLIGIT